MLATETMLASKRRTRYYLGRSLPSRRVRAMQMIRLLTLLSLFTVVGCGDTQEVAPTQSQDTDLDAGSDIADSGADAADSDAPDLPEVVPCEATPREGNFALAPDAPDGQIHAASAWDGQTLWLTYNVPDAEGTFDVWVAGFDCGGNPTLAPQRVNTTDFNDVDPAIAAQHGQIIIAWGTDNGMQPDNLSLRYRRMNPDGTYLDAEDRIFPNEGNTWMPSIAPAADGTWELAGVRAGETEFRVFRATLDADGNPGELTHFEEGLPGTQAGPSLLVHGQDEWLAWTHDGEQVRLSTAEGIEALDGAGPSLGWGPNGPIFAWTSGMEVVTRDLATGVETRFSEPNKQLHSGIAKGEVTAWYRQIRGIRSQLYWAGPDGRKTWLETEITVAPYGIALTDLGDGSYFIAWSEGDSPAFRINGRLLRP
jgi:hypothetical protein